MKLRHLLILPWLALAPAGALAQQPGPPPPRAHGEHWSGHGPIERLLAERDSLGLNDAQVLRLEAIRARVERENAPLVRRVMEIRRRVKARWVPRPQRTPEQQAAFQATMREARPLIQKIHQNNRAAMVEVGVVLTPAQKERLRAMIHERWGEHGRRDGRPGRDRGPGA